MENNILAGLNYLLGFSLVFSIQLGIIFLLRRPVAYFFGAVAAYWLWLLPIIWLPFFVIDWSFVAFDFSLFQTEALSASGAVSSVLERDYILPVIQFFEFDFFATELLYTIEPSSFNNNLGLMLFLIWVIGLSFLFFRLLFQMRQFSKLIKQFAKPLESEIFKECLVKSNFKVSIKLFFFDGINSPALYGCFSPVLLLPENFLKKYSEEQRRLILVHEGVHLRRKDNVWNVLVAFLRIIFWFNPLVHVAHRYYHLDQEVSCDAQALENSSYSTGKNYALSLLESANIDILYKNPKITAWGSLTELKERMMAITKLQKKTINLKFGFYNFLFVALLGGVLTACTTIKEDSIGIVSENSNGIRVELREDLLEFGAYLEKEDYSAAKGILDEVMNIHKEHDLTKHEEFALLSAYSALAMRQQEYRRAIDYHLEMLSFKGVVSEVEFGNSLRALSALYTMFEEYENAQVFLKRYNDEILGPDEDAYKQLALIQFGAKEYQEGLASIMRYMDILEEKGELIERTDYVLQRAFYYHLDDKEGFINTLQKIVDKFQIEEDIKELDEMKSVGVNISFIFE